MAPTLTAVRERTYNDILEQDNADILSSRLNDIGDPTKWVTEDEFIAWEDYFFSTISEEKEYA
jgi:hypothetical protein